MRGGVALTRSALLFATAEADDDLPAAALAFEGRSVVARLIDQLETLGVRRVWVATRPPWSEALRDRACGSTAEVTVVESPDVPGDLRVASDIAGRARGSLVIALADIVVHREALANLLVGPRPGSAVLVRGGTGAFLRVMSVESSDLERLADASARLGRLPAAAADDAVALLGEGLVRSDPAVRVSDLRGFFYARPSSQSEASAAQTELRSLDEDRIALDAAVKATDGFFTTFFVSPYSKYIARFAARRGWTPNAMTSLSMLIGMASAAAFAVGSRAGLIAGAVLLQVAFTVDCVDGQLARYTRTFSKLGAWLDSVFDRGKEYLVYAGLAIGSTRGFGEDVWLLAACALTLQTVRHMVVFSSPPAARRTAPLARAEPEDDVAGLAGRGIAAVTSLERWSATRWAKRIIALPIGERFALISVTAAVASPRVTFWALLGWGGVAGLYSGGGRLLRAVVR